MTEVANPHDVKTAHLSRLIGGATVSENANIALFGTPPVPLVPVVSIRPREPGPLKGRITPDAVFDPLPEDRPALRE